MSVGPNGLPTVKIIPRYLEHNGGTKFYEVMGFEFEGERILVKRWGANEFFKKLDQGPDIKIERLGTSSVAASVDAEVKARTSAKKGYERITVTQGFHRAMSDSAYDLEVDAFLTMVNDHYGTTRATKIKSFFKDVEDVDLSGALGDLGKPPNPPPAKTVDRGEQWGAW